MIKIDKLIPLAAFKKPLERMWEASEKKLWAIEKANKSEDRNALVFTREGRYVPQDWTDWTRGFRIGSMLLQAEATDSKEFLNYARDATVEHILPQITSFGVHDHGFTVTSTFGALLRLMDEGVIPHNEWERKYYVQALITSGVVQANRWTEIEDNLGFIHSFNGPHSLFADTIRSLRALVIAHLLGGVLRGEEDQIFSLLDRVIAHIIATSRYIVCSGFKDHGYDELGQVTHEAIFNVRTGTYRCPSTQQGYSPFTSWTRGLAWIILGFAELFEFFRLLPRHYRRTLGNIEFELYDVLRWTTVYYVENSPTCGVPYWDTGAPDLENLENWAGKDADPFNDWEPVDSSAAAIAAQGFLRLGKIMGRSDGRRYQMVGRKIAYTLLNEPYLSTDPNHQGLLLHSVYHWPQRWDHIPKGSYVTHGESVMWGDYHLRELALYIGRLSRSKKYYAFTNFDWDPLEVQHYPTKDWTDLLYGSRPL